MEDRQVLESLQRRADSDDSKAQRELAIRMQTGQGAAQSYELAAHWYQSAAQLGDVVSQRRLAYLYKEGRGVGKNWALAAHWLQKAAGQNDAVSQRWLGSLYEKGQGVPESGALAAHWYRKAADQGNALAQNNLGDLHSKGVGVDQSQTKAAYWYRLAADQGDATAQCSLGHLYLEGLGVKQSWTEAAQLLTEAAEQGDAEAQYALGGMYWDGQGVKSHWETAFWLFTMAADKGLPDAQYLVGSCYAAGLEVGQSWTKAAFWYREAAHEGNSLSQTALGELYAEGLGADQDWDRALWLFEKAACDPCNVEGHVWLAWLLWTGTGGVPQDRARAKDLCIAVERTAGYDERLLLVKGVGSWWPKVLSWFEKMFDGGYFHEPLDAALDPDENLKADAKSNPEIPIEPDVSEWASRDTVSNSKSLHPKTDSRTDVELGAEQVLEPDPKTDPNPQNQSTEEPSQDATHGAPKGSWLDELRLFLETNGGLQSVPVLPKEKSRHLLQRFLSSKTRISEAEERMKGSPAASAYFTEMHQRLGNLFTGAQAIGSGNVQSSESMFAAVVSFVAEQSVSGLPLVGGLAAGAVKLGMQAFQEREMRKAAKKVSRIAPGLLAQQVANAVALGLALGREGVVQVLWTGGGRPRVPFAQKVRQRWATLTGLPKPEARLRGLVKDDLGRILESILSGRITGVQGDTDGVEVCRRLIDVGLEASPGKAKAAGVVTAGIPVNLTADNPVVVAAGLGNVANSPVGGGAVAQAGLPVGYTSAATGGAASSPLDLVTLQGQIEVLHRKLERVPRLEAEMKRLRSRLRKPGACANPQAASGGSMIQLLHEDDAEGFEGSAARIENLQGQIDVLQAAVVAFQAELGAGGQRVVFVDGGISAEAPRWFEREGVLPVGSPAGAYILQTPSSPSHRRLE